MHTPAQATHPLLRPPFKTLVVQKEGVHWRQVDDKVSRTSSLRIHRLDTTQKSAIDVVVEKGERNNVVTLDKLEPKFLVHDSTRRACLALRGLPPISVSTVSTKLWTNSTPWNVLVLTTARR